MDQPLLIIAIRALCRNSFVPFLQWPLWIFFFHNWFYSVHWPMPHAWTSMNRTGGTSAELQLLPEHTKTAFKRKHTLQTEHPVLKGWATVMIISSQEKKVKIKSTWTLINWDLVCSKQKHSEMHKHIMQFSNWILIMGWQTKNRSGKDG